MPTYTEYNKNNKANSQRNHRNKTAPMPMFITKKEDPQEAMHNRLRPRIIRKKPIKTLQNKIADKRKTRRE